MRAWWSNSTSAQTYTKGWGSYSSFRKVWSTIGLLSKFASLRTAVKCRCFLYFLANLTEFEPSSSLIGSFANSVRQTSAYGVALVRCLLIWTIELAECKNCQVPCNNYSRWFTNGRTSIQTCWVVGISDWSARTLQIASHCMLLCACALSDCQSM